MRLFPRELALRLPLFHGVHRFLGPLFLREGCRILQVPVNHRPRAHGHSHYSIWNRSLNVLVDLAGVKWLMARPVPSMLGMQRHVGRPSSKSARVYSSPLQGVVSPADIREA